MRLYYLRGATISIPKAAAKASSIATSVKSRIDRLSSQRRSLVLQYISLVRRPLVFTHPKYKVSKGISMAEQDTLETPYNRTVWSQLASTTMDGVAACRSER